MGMAATPNRAGALNVFVDTNLFVQCRALEDLAWVDILKAEEIRAEHQNALAIRLLMPRVVLRELERQKHGASPRRRDRARNAIGRMRKALRAGSRLLV